MKKIIKYVFLDILKNKIVIAYTLFLLVATIGLFMMEDVPEKSLASLLTINLFLIPLISIVFTSMYLYNLTEFIELLSAQPIKRKTLWLGIFSGINIALLVSFIIGCAIPILIFAGNEIGITMILTGMFLTIIFVSISMLASVHIKDKAKGVGVSLLLWFYFALLFDGIVLFLLFQLIDYSLENMIVGLSILNPIDLARIITILKMDMSAMMGATSAVFNQTFAGVVGSIISYSILSLWALIPLYFSTKKFVKKDL